MACKCGLNKLLNFQFGAFYKVKFARTCEETCYFQKTFTNQQTCNIFLFIICSLIPFAQVCMWKCINMHVKMYKVAFLPWKLSLKNSQIETYLNQVSFIYEENSSILFLENCWTVLKCINISCILIFYKLSNYKNFSN